ncbi:hypothetical protein L1049_028043 [Liquidambar formosana]|uniref:Uncharacterized protein n=1 Tax=Liquidambar formosana TaxID=63359 RepID=A0AAP0RJT2_LIQFO
MVASELSIDDTIDVDDFVDQIPSHTDVPQSGDQRRWSESCPADGQLLVEGDTSDNASMEVLRLTIVPLFSGKNQRRKWRQLKFNRHSKDTW